MFEKMLFRGEVLYFRYAPPLTDLDEISDDRLPNPPFKGAQKHERSVFYYWWAFLREHEGYLECCNAGGSGPMSNLYADFGDVRGESFMDWWRAGARLLFCEPDEEKIVAHLSPPRTPVSDHHVLVSIPVTGDLDRTLAEMRKILKGAFERARKQRLKETPQSDPRSRAVYPVHAKPVLTALHERLVTHRVRKANPTASLYEIAEKTGIAELTGGKKGDADHQGAVRARVSRTLKEARALIYNVGEGRFPDMSAPPKS